MVYSLKSQILHNEEIMPRSKDASLLGAIRSQQRHQSLAHRSNTPEVAERVKKLPPESVIEILTMSKGGRGGALISSDLKIRPSTVYNIIHRYRLCKNSKGEVHYRLKSAALTRRPRRQ